MIPAAFEYQRATSLDDALAALAGGDAKVLAGGMSLLPLMKLRLASPGTLVDIGGLDELKGVGPTADGGLEIGALTTYAERRWPRRASSASPASAVARSATSRSATAGRSAGRSAMPTRPVGPAGAARWRSTTQLVLRSTRGERTVPASTGSSWAPSRPPSNPTRSSSQERRSRSRTRRRRLVPEAGEPGLGVLPSSGVAAVVAASGGSVTHARVALTGVGEVAVPGQGRRGGARWTATDLAAPSPPRPSTPTTGRPSTATSTRIASIERAWPWSTPVARSRPRSAASAARRTPDSAPRCASNGSVPVDACPARLVGAILTRDLVVGGRRWSKGRRLTDDDLAALATADPGRR